MIFGRHPSSSRRLLARLAAGSLALGAAACGTGGSDLFQGGSGGAGATSTGTGTGSGTGTGTSTGTSTGTATGSGGSGGGATGCTPGVVVDCYEGPEGTLGTGACKGGKKTCNANGDGFGACEGQVLPVAETCLTPIDDDCNGQTNEGGDGCACKPGEVLSCYSGPPGTEGVGACKGGTRVCNDAGTEAGPCEGEVTPQPETCLTPGDEDCNGKANEGGDGCTCVPGAIAPCYTGPAGTEGVGACKGGTQTCLDSGTGYGDCKGEVVPVPETCDTPIDDDCNGKTNEGGVGCVCPPGAAQSCYAGPAGTLGVGVCQAGSQLCDALGKGWGACVGQVLPTPETCNDAVDNDCNGQVNEGGAGCVCLPNSTKPCYEGPAGTLGLGACKAGAQACNALGTGWGACTGQVLPALDGCGNAVDEDCNGVAFSCPQGQFCDANSNACVQDPCAPGVLGTSNVGCEYYATITSNAQLADKVTFQFGVSIANANATAATITITRGGQNVATGTLPAGTVQVYTMPWISELLSANATVLSRAALSGGAYRIVSSLPVTVAQWNPTQAVAANNAYSATVDTSLLLPVNAWGTSYRVASRNQQAGRPGFYAVVATQDNTVVTLGPSATGGNVRAGAGVQANGTGTVTLAKGDVLQVLTAGGNTDPDPSDLTGTLVTSNLPVQVIGGHDCTRVPYNLGYCDHLEESMLPISALGKTYVLTSPRVDAGTPRNQAVRVVATQSGTTLVYDPPIANAPAWIANAGDYVEIGPLPDSFKVTASAKVLVAQYIVGDAQNTNVDPSMSLAIPLEQTRSSYQLFAPGGGGWTSFVNITAPTGATVLLDGAAPAVAWSPIGGTGLSWARFPLAPTGSHLVSSPQVIGAEVYGFGTYTSTFYPAGTNLLALP